MRGLLDSLYKMDSPFNCPHGRPTIVSIGNIQDKREIIAFKK
jgi:DNA mismatch repair ATPase MutL